jgi:deoxyadenosine/deoxycytidine kinase
LYAPVEKLLANIKKRGRDYEQGIPAEYLEGIQNAYLEYFKLQTNARIVLLDTTNMNWLESKVDYERVKEILNAEWSVGLHYV